MFSNLQADDPKYDKIPLSSFFVFIGTALSITAFPVLARLLKEGGLLYSRAGSLAMGAAALNDAIAWCLLILAISIAHAKNMGTAGLVFLSVCAFGLGLYFVIRPFFELLVKKAEEHKPKYGCNRNNLFALTLILVFLSAWTTALLGVDAIFGAFLFGLIVPRDSQLFKDCNEYIEELVLTFTLPLYFALSGLKTDITQIHSGKMGAMIILVCVAATAGKLIGCGGTALVGRLSFRESATVAVLMNTRGLVELIVLNLGMKAGILNTRTFSVMVIMCLFTTFITSPIVALIYPPHLRVEAKPTHTEVKSSSPDEAVQTSKTRADSTLQPNDITTETKKEEEHLFTPMSEDNVLTMEKQSRICIVMSYHKHLQGLMNLVTAISPRKNRRLSIMALNFEEPTYTEADLLVSLNENDRVVEIELEGTNYPDELVSFAEPKLPKLLPFSMLCNSLGCAVTSATVRGNPSDFPYELRSMIDAQKIHLIIMPWENNDFTRQLFWGNIQTLDQPIALYVQVYSPQPNPTELERPRGQSGSLICGIGTNEVEQPGYSPFEIELVSGEEIRKPASTPKKPIALVAALITGNITDMHIFQILFWLLAEKEVQAHIFLPNNFQTFPQSIVKMKEHFEQQFERVPRISFEQINHSPTNVQGLIAGLLSKNMIFDLFLYSYFQEDQSDPSQLLQQLRSRQKSFVQSLRELSSEPAATEKNLRLGVPATLAEVAPYPALGELGNCLIDVGVALNFLIFHEPRVERKVGSGCFDEVVTV